MDRDKFVLLSFFHLLVEGIIMHFLPPFPRFDGYAQNFNWVHTPSLRTFSMGGCKKGFADSFFCFRIGFLLSGKIGIPGYGWRKKRGRTSPLRPLLNHDFGTFGLGWTPKKPSVRRAQRNACCVLKRNKTNGIKRSLCTHTVPSFYGLVSRRIIAQAKDNVKQFLWNYHEDLLYNWKAMFRGFLSRLR